MMDSSDGGKRQRAAPRELMLMTCGGRRLGRLAAGCLAFAWLAVGALGSWSPLGFRRGARRWLGSRLAPWGAGFLLVCFVAATMGIIASS